MTDFRFAAWKRLDNDEGLSVEHLPGFRKSACLVVTKGNQGQIVAYFRSDEMANVFSDWLSDLLEKSGVLPKAPQ